MIALHEERLGVIVQNEYFLFKNFRKFRISLPFLTAPWGDGTRTVGFVVGIIGGFVVGTTTGDIVVWITIGGFVVWITTGEWVVCTDSVFVSSPNLFSTSTTFFLPVKKEHFSLVHLREDKNSNKKEDKNRQKRISSYTMDVIYGKKRYSFAILQSIEKKTEK